MHNILTLSGWGQSPDSLLSHELKIPGARSNFFDYSQYPSIETALEQLRSYPCDLLIGWSLGGQIALRATAAKILSPRALILLAPPFQFLKSQDVQDGIPPELLKQVKERYIQDPKEMLLGFASLLCLDDSKIKQILPILQRNTHPSCPNWLYWLEELARYSCSNLDFTMIPKTFILHGVCDRVIPITQTTLFSAHIPTSHIHPINNCGHAPHLHAPQLFLSTIHHAISF